MNATPESLRPARPWYRQFWPWFLIALPASAVIGGLITIFVAVENRDGLVVDDYYKEGLAINVQLDRERRAAELGLAARVRHDPAQRQLEVFLEGAPAVLAELDRLELWLAHPTRANKDRHIQMARVAPGHYVSELRAMAPGRWHLILSSPEGDWRLTGRLDLTHGGQTRITPSD